MTKRIKSNFIVECRLECAQFVVDKGYSMLETAKVTSTGKSSLDNGFAN